MTKKCESETLRNAQNILIIQLNYQNGHLVETMKQNSRFALQVCLLPDILSCSSMLSVESEVQIAFCFIGGRVANMFYLGPN